MDEDNPLLMARDLAMALAFVIAEGVMALLAVAIVVLPVWAAVALVRWIAG